MDFNTRRFSVFVNGALAGTYPKEQDPREKKRRGRQKSRSPKKLKFTPDEGSDLVIAGDRGSFRGKIDEVRIGSISNDDQEELAPAVRILSTDDEPIEVHFDASGKLHPAIHQKPVTIVLAARSEEDKQESITVNLMGVVE
jgi:hypothetical protein